MRTLTIDAQDQFLPRNVNKLVVRICRLAAMATARYAEISAMPTNTLREHFIESFVADGLQADGRVRLQVPIWSLGLKSADDIAYVIGSEASVSGVVDTVIYDDNDPGVPVIFVEYKLFKYNTRDRERLVRLLKRLDKEAFGVRCVLYDGQYDDWLYDCRAEANLNGEVFIAECVSANKNDHKVHSIYCHVVTRSSSLEVDALKTVSDRHRARST